MGWPIILVQTETETANDSWTTCWCSRGDVSPVKTPTVQYIASHQWLHRSNSNRSVQVHSNRFSFLPQVRSCDPLIWIVAEKPMCITFRKGVAFSPRNSAFSFYKINNLLFCFQKFHILVFMSTSWQAEETAFYLCSEALHASPYVFHLK